MIAVYFDVSYCMYFFQITILLMASLEETKNLWNQIYLHTTLCLKESTCLSKRRTQQLVEWTFVAELQQNKLPFVLYLPTWEVYYYYNSRWSTLPMHVHAVYILYNFFFFVSFLMMYWSWSFTWCNVRSKNNHDVTKNKKFMYPLRKQDMIVRHIDRIGTYDTDTQWQ